MNPPAAKHKHTVLLVDEDAVQLGMIRDYLLRAEFVVQSATDAWSAMRMVRESGVELVIVNLAGAERVGQGLREKCALLPEGRDLPFLFIAPEADKDLQVRSLRAGVDDFVTAPFDPVVLVARSQAILARRAAYEELVRVDPMTRLLNRRTFNEELEREIERLLRYERAASLLVLDVEGLEQLNQEHGIAAGDLLLTCLSGVVLSNIRNIDLAGRCPGGSIAVLLPETPAPGARLLGDRISERLGAIAQHIAGTTIQIRHGVSTAPEDGGNVSDLLAAAMASFPAAGS
ncbi:MAG: diguanylate cyclase [Candidatus Hydrogenedens sp.]|nr:diguanylate cyclase [Candidatus Hydrogenedens sp.]